MDGTEEGGWGLQMVENVLNGLWEVLGRLGEETGVLRSLKATRLGGGGGGLRE